MIQLLEYQLFGKKYTILRELITLYGVLERLGERKWARGKEDRHDKQRR